MPEPILLIVLIVFLALVFNFGNGMNDAANAISTIVATRVVPFRAAILLAAVFNSIGALVFGVAVATTIGKGIVDPSTINTYVVLSSLLGAIIWVFLTTWLGLPISVSHSIIGGFVGAAFVHSGINSIMLPKFLMVASFIFIAPLLGLIGSFLFSALVLHLFKKSSSTKVNKYFKKLQLISAAVYSLGHGTNDAQNTMGIIAVLLFINGFLGATFHVPVWVILASTITMGLGTYAGGRKVIKTMGLRITKIKPVDGFCAETSGAGAIILCSLMGIPVSTTHVISGAIVGTGLTKRVSAVRWVIARKVLLAWIFTLPLSALLAGMIYSVISLASRVIV